MMHFGRVLVTVGLLLVALGLGFLLAEKLGLGRLPGDLVWKRKNTTVYFPVVTSLIVSLVLTVLLNLVIRRK